MSYALQGLGAPLVPSGVPTDYFPVEERNGLFWVKEAARAAAVQLVGTKTDFQGTNEGGGAVYGSLFLRQTATAKNWVLEEVAKGRAVAVAPQLSAGSLARAFTTASAADLVYDTAKSTGGRYAILAAPPALVAQAEALAAQPPPPGEPAPPALPPSSTPATTSSSSGGVVGFWNGLSTPAKVGVAAGGVGVLALLVLGVSKAFRPNRRRRGRKRSYRANTDRFDRAEALWLFASQYHGGQGSREYKTLSRLNRAGFRPRPSLRSRADLTVDGKRIYDALVREHRGRGRGYRRNARQLMSGYAYELDRGTRWRNAADDRWDTAVITPDGTEKFLGQRYIDGVKCNVFRMHGKIYAQVARG